MSEFKCFGSVADFVADCGEIGGEKYSEYVRAAASPRSRWFGGPLDTALDFCRSGDLVSVPAAEKLADRICDNVDISGLVPSWSLDVAGAFCCVPEYLAGSPECMFAQNPAPSTAAPLSVFVELGAAGDIKANDMRRRAACLLAAVMAISRVRPVRLRAFSCLKNRPIIIDMSFPLDVSEVCGFFDPVVYRRVVLWHSYLFKHKDFGVRADWFGDDRKTRREVCAAVGCNEDDVLVLTRQGLSAWAQKSEDDFIGELNRMIRAVKAAA